MSEGSMTVLNSFSSKTCLKLVFLVFVCSSLPCFADSYRMLMPTNLQQMLNRYKQMRLRELTSATDTDDDSFNSKRHILDDDYHNNQLSDQIHQVALNNVAKDTTSSLTGGNSDHLAVPANRIIREHSAENLSFGNRPKMEAVSKIAQHSLTRFLLNGRK